MATSFPHSYILIHFFFACSPGVLPDVSGGRAENGYNGPPVFPGPSSRATGGPLHRRRFDRRTFLKAAAGGALLFLSGNALPRRASGGTVPPGPRGVLSLYHTHTGERLSFACRDVRGEHDPGAVSELNRILRCHFTGEVAEIDLRVIDFLEAMDGNLGGGKEIHIVSGYRSPGYNAKLLREGRGVARNSLHLQGRAIDLRIPGIRLESLREAALRLREGGVGYYPGSGFVHIDSGRFRVW